MANMIQSAKDQVAQITRAAYEAAAAEGVLPAGVELKGSIEIPKDPQNGDYASSAAMAYISDNNTDKAAELLRRCAELEPKRVEPYIYLLNLYPNENSRPWDVAQMLRQGYEKTGDARLQAAANPSGSAGVSNATAQE